MKLFGCLFWIICSPLATLPALADEASVLSAPTVRSPVSVSLQTRAAKTLHRSARAIVIDLGPLPVEEEDTDTEAPPPQYKPRQIGIHRPLPREFQGNLVPHLDWTVDRVGRQHTAITFQAEGAVSLRIAVQAALPSGASVQVFDGDDQPRGSPFTSAAFSVNEQSIAPPLWLLDVLPTNVKFNASQRPRVSTPVWLPSAEGDTLTVKIVLPSAEDVAALVFSVPSVAHRFASASAKEGAPVCPGHLDLPCIDFDPDEHPPQLVHHIADAVGRMRFEDGGITYVCTGTLLNTVGTPEVYEPYFLTANHCVGTNTVASTVEVAWFWQSTICDRSVDSRDPRVTFSFRGTELLATSPAQDATLLWFKEILPGGLVYAGWTLKEVTKDVVFTVHHPNGYFAQVTSGRVQRTLEAAAVEGGSYLYNALLATWDFGPTEGGSSGAGLFLMSGPEQGHLVGVLAAGDPTCDPRGHGDLFGPFRDFFPQIRQWLAAHDYEEPEPGAVLHMLPAVLGAGGDIQSFVRIMNDSDRAGEVEIHAIDDAGQRHGPVTIELGSYQTRHFNSADLERGAPSKGLFGGVGDGTGMWRLELKTTLTIDPRAYVRTSDGFVTSMHQVAEVFEAEVEGQDTDLPVHFVPFFNPGSNTAIRSLLRVINPNSASAYVMMTAKDDDGNQSADWVKFTLAANSAIQISSQTLEQGDTAFSGFFGDGTGKWTVVVFSLDDEESLFSEELRAGPPIHVMSLLSTPSGHLTNLSR